MKLDVCICTHNPRQAVFRLALQAVCRQTLDKGLFHLWIIDNSSYPQIRAQDYPFLKDAGVVFSIVREERLGNVHARERAIRETTEEWVVFVDDDNELADDYLANVVRIIKENPGLGCFGGKLLLPDDFPSVTWAVPLLPYLAIKNSGDAVITRCAEEWGPWVPPTAGAAVCRSVLEAYVRLLGSMSGASELGRKGRKGLMSAEDALMMRGANKLGLPSSYQPSLRLIHHIDPSRVCFSYLLRLCYGYGRSEVILERCLGNNVAAAGIGELLRLLTRIPLSREKACRLARKWGYFAQSRVPNSFEIKREESQAVTAAPTA